MLEWLRLHQEHALAWLLEWLRLHQEHALAWLRESPGVVAMEFPGPSAVQYTTLRYGCDNRDMALGWFDHQHLHQTCGVWIPNVVAHQ